MSLLNQHLILKAGRALYWGRGSSPRSPGIVTDFYPIDNQRSSNLRIAITGTVVVHALLLVLLAFVFASEAAHRLWLEAHQPPKEEKKEEEVLLFPEQFLTTPPPPKPKPERMVYMRTSQNEGAEMAPKNPAFISDRNTNASTKKAPSPDATEPMPSMDGIKIKMQELADRDFNNGDLKDDARPKTQPPEVAMLAPKPPAPPTPEAPPSILKPKDAAPPQPPKPQTVLTPKPETTTPETEKPVETPKMAKVEPDKTPLTKMMEEADKELAKVDMNRLPLEVKKPDPMEKTPDAPPTTKPAPKKLELAEDMPPPTPQEKPIPKALPVVEDEAVKRTTRNEDPNAFTPHTRKSETKGTIFNRGDEEAVDAKMTPLGIYDRQVRGMVERKWNIYVKLRRDGMTYASLKLVFYVNKKGKVEGLRVLDDKESNPVLTEVTVRAIQDAEIPPIPADVLPLLPEEDGGRYKINYNVLIY
jgi:outer membrane biosynthesis protein TonB